MSISSSFTHVGDQRFRDRGDWPKSKEFKETAEAIRKSGKATVRRFLHPPSQTETRSCRHAADGGFVDAIMLQNNPWIAEQIAKMNRGTRCLPQGGHRPDLDEAGRRQYRSREDRQRLPDLKEKGLSPYQGLLHAIWTDERFASCCVSMRNTDQVRENAEAARVFKPLTKAELESIARRLSLPPAGPSCAGCDGPVQPGRRHDGRAGQSHTVPHLSRPSRLSGRSSAALRRASRRRPQLGRADLEAARQACPNKLDFAKLLPRTDQVLG